MKQHVLWIYFLLLLLPVASNAAPMGIVYTKQFREEAAVKPKNGAPGPQFKTKLLYHGGPVISQIKAYAVMWGPQVDSATKSGIGAMITAIVNSSYWDMLQQYQTNIKSVDGRAGTGQQITRGSFAGVLSIHPANTKTTIDDTEIGAELEHQIDLGALPKPDQNTVYLTYFPPGMTITLQGSKSCAVFCGYHHNYTSNSYGILYYSVQPDLGGSCAFGCGFGTSKFENVTAVTSHEITEAATDPAVSNTPGQTAWNTADGKEIGDLCSSTEVRLNMKDGSSFLLQSAFDNRTASCPAGPFQSL